MRKTYIILLFIMVACMGCEWRLRADEHADGTQVTIERYDRMEHLYLSSGDFAALQQMKTNFPQQTRLLLEEVLRLGPVDDPDINVRFLLFFQDSTLQALLSDAEREYASVDDIEKELTESFGRLCEMLPSLSIPVIYMQIGSLDQSIVVGDSVLGISLDKYLGVDYPLYQKFSYSERQRQMMSRDYIVPDCLSFYLLSLYPARSVSERDSHMARIQHVVNKALDRRVFSSSIIDRMASEWQLKDGDYEKFLSE